MKISAGLNALLMPCFQVINAVQCYSLLSGHLKIVMIGVLKFQKCLQFNKASQFTSLFKNVFQVFL